MSDEKDNVVQFTGPTILPIDPVQVLKGIAQQPDLKDVWVIAVRTDGEIMYHSSTSDLMEAYYRLGKWQHAIMNGDLVPNT